MIALGLLKGAFRCCSNLFAGIFIDVRLTLGAQRLA